MNPELPTVDATVPTHQNLVDLNSERAKKARLEKIMSKTGFKASIVLAILGFLLAGLALISNISHLPGLVAAFSLALLLWAIWWRGDLHPLKVKDASTLTSRLSRSALARLNPKQQITPKQVWSQYKKQWQARFITHRLMLPDEIIEQSLSDDPADMTAVWQAATRYADESNLQQIELGHVVAAMLKNSASIKQILTSLLLKPDDIDLVASWLGRSVSLLGEDKPNYGGVARDWTHGYTPMLDRFGYNVSLDIEKKGAHFGWLSQSDTVSAIYNSLTQGTNAIALVGEPGVGKTSHIYALAQKLLQSSTDKRFEHIQIVSLNASTLIAAASGGGQLESLINRLFSEAAHAGHIILFLDNAEQFFNQSVGAFDATNVLLPIIQSRAVTMILAVTPRDYQQIKSKQSSLASLITTIAVNEPPEAAVIHILQDTALGLELQHKAFITQQAINEAYKLSGRYDNDVAYPGRAINVLEQSLAFGDQGIITAKAVQTAIEQTRGVRVSQASSDEQGVLLNLESLIHERMINQTRAVSVVSNALRRARAGVSNPNRPVGSFLFLGPTGVGKTELAKSLAAIYFGAESNMIRLDMSEYQRAEDVARLLSDGSNEQSNLLLAVRQQPFSVVLLDEIEKAHPNILNLLLQLLDEGNLTDVNGRSASFKDSIIICTSNAGADTIRERITAGEEVDKLEDVMVDELIASGQFRPELLNRFDEIVVFRPLDKDELTKVVQLMVQGINRTLADKQIQIALTDDAVNEIINRGYDARLGARPMRRALQRAVEDVVAGKILRGEAKPGDQLTLDAPDLG